MKERRGSAQAKSPQYDTLPSCNRCQQGSDDQEYGILGRHQKTEIEKNIDGFQLPMRKPSCFQCQSVIHKRVTNISGYNSHKFSQFCTKQTNFSSSAYTSVALKSDTLHRLIVGTGSQNLIYFQKICNLPFYKLQENIRILPPKKSIFLWYLLRYGCSSMRRHVKPPRFNIPPSLLVHRSPSSHVFNKT